MIIEVLADSSVRLDEPTDFRKFKILARLTRASLATLKTALDGIATVDSDAVAWVSESALRKWVHAHNDEAWQAGLTAMIAKASQFGWVDSGRGAIRAHIEWAE